MSEKLKTLMKNFEEMMVATGIPSEHKNIAQIVDMRRSFFGGAAVMFSVLTDIGDMNEDDACVLLSEYEYELKAFAHVITNGLDHNAIHVELKQVRPGGRN